MRFVKHIMYWITIFITNSKMLVFRVLWCATIYSYLLFGNYYGVFTTTCVIDIPVKRDITVPKEDCEGNSLQCQFSYLCHRASSRLEQVSYNNHVASLFCILHHARLPTYTSNHMKSDKKNDPSQRFVDKELLLDMLEKLFVWTMTMMLYCSMKKMLIQWMLIILTIH